MTQLTNVPKPMVRMMDDTKAQEGKKMPCSP